METNEGGKPGALNRAKNAAGTLARNIGTAIIDRIDFERDDPERVSLKKMAGQLLTETAPNRPIPPAGTEEKPITVDGLAGSMGIYALDSEAIFREKFPRIYDELRIHFDDLVRSGALRPIRLPRPNRGGETLGYVVENREVFEEIWNKPEDKK